MFICYLPIHFGIKFSSPIHSDTPSLFILRSMLGKELRSMCCIARQNKCPDCMCSKTCAYAFLFETILPVENEIAPGRDRASHPFAFTGGSLFSGDTISEYGFTITLFGKACEYLPYIYAAFVRAGKNGLFKSRTPFSVTKVCVCEKNVLIDTEHIDTSVPAKTWSLDLSKENRNGEILVELKTPLRFKYGGKYGTDFSAQDFFKCLYRRARTLCSLYGNADNMPDYIPSDEIVIAERKLGWEDFRHYSARQKEEMCLGGALGTLKLKGAATAMEQSILEFNRISNAGKNTNFGLGQFDYWTKWE